MDFKTNKKYGVIYADPPWTFKTYSNKGKPKRLNKSIPQLVVSQRQEHSRKPDIVYNHIEKMLEGPYIELFARRKRDGWFSWGNEV